MRKFKIFLYNKKYSRLITSFDNESQSSHNEFFSTFDEELQESENDQFNFTFSMAHWIYINGKKEKNYWIDLIKFGSRIRIEIDSDQEIRLIINKIEPKISKDNIIYHYSAQDEISLLWARHNTGYSYSTIQNGKVETIYEIAEKTLRDNFLNDQWRVYDEESINTIDPLRSKPITLEVTDSNPYNVIIEACNTLNCLLKVNYKKQYISFYQKNNIPFSGYRYRSETNLKDFSVSCDANDMSTILHVTGGTDEYGQLITLVPQIPTALQLYLLEISNNNKWPDENIWTKITLNDLTPYLTTPEDTEKREQELNEITDFLKIANNVQHLGQFLSNFSYFKQSKIMSQQDFDHLNRIFNYQMRNNNIWLKIYTPKLYRKKWQIAETLNYIFNMGSQYEAEYQYIEERVKNSAGTSSEYTTTNLLTEKLPQIEEDIKNAIGTDENLLFLNFASLYGVSEGGSIVPVDAPIETIQKLFNSYDEIKDWIESRDKNIKLAEESTLELDILEQQISKISDINSPVYMELEQKIELLKNNIITYKTLGSGWTINIWGQEWKVSGLYDLLLNNMFDSFVRIFRTGALHKQENITKIINNYESSNKLLWREIYNNYGDFIYEAAYQNEDELDSVSLYNQGIIYFENQNKPIANYNISVIDSSKLELIDIPRLKIGSKIRIYNKLLDFDDEKENILTYSNNEVIVTGLSYQLRNLGNISISVEQTRSYEAIIEKILLSIKK